MTRFLVLIHVDENGSSGPPSESMLSAMRDFQTDTTYGQIIDDGGLAPSSSALRVQSDAGRVAVLDGPYAEAKEVVGGFFVVESSSAADIAIWTRAFIELHAAHWPGLSFVAEVREIATDPGA